MEPPAAAPDRHAPPAPGQAIARTGLDRREDLVRGATLLDRTTAPGERPGEERRIALWKTGFKHPLVRIEETWRDDTLVSWRGMVADHVLIRTLEDLDDTALHDLSARLGMPVRRDLHTARTYLLEIPGGGIDAVPDALARLDGHPALAFAEPDYLLYAMDRVPSTTGVAASGTSGRAKPPAEPQWSPTATLPDDASFGDLWGLNNTGQDGGTADVDIDAPEAWDLTTGNPNITVGVIDTGIQYDHPDLAANIWTNPGEIPGDNIDNDGNGFVDDIHGWDFAYDDSDPMDGEGHGTHCSGTIGGVGDNGTGVAGVNWTVRLMALKFLDDNGFGSTADAVDAVTYGTANGADLTSNSWGGGGYSEALFLAIAEAGSNGIPFVAAAGNSSSDNDETENYPSNYDAPNVIAVAAYDRNGNLASFSSYGATTVDVGAPGVTIYSTLNESEYGNLSGTSMATPHVAGLVALMRGVNPGLTPAEILQFLIDTADPMPALAGRTVANGGINAFAAVQSVAGAFVTLQSTVLTDDGSGGTAGNGDGFLNPGETVGLRIGVRNFGTEGVTGVFATLASGDAAISVSNPILRLGDIPAQAQVSATNDFLLGIGAAPTPYPVGMTLYFWNGSQAWTSRFDLTVFTSTAVSGLVDSASGPLAGARIAYTGPRAGAVTSGIDGLYRVVLTDGDYQLTASGAGYLPDGPKPVAATGTPVQIDFFLTRPELDVSIDPVALTLKQCETAEISIGLTNLGDGPLIYELIGLPDRWTPETGTLWHVSARRAYEGQESWYYGQEETGSYDTGEANRGSLISEPMLLPPGDPVFSFHSWRETENSGLWDVSQLDVSTNRGATWITLLSAADTTQTWQEIAADLGDYADQPVNLRFRFDTIDSVFNNFEGWYVDRFRLNGSPLGWLDFAAPTGRIDAGLSDEVTLSISPAMLQPGVYTSSVALLSNDGDEGYLSIPISLTVSASPRYEGHRWIVSGDDDGDGQPEPGETFDLFLVVTNAGGLASPGDLDLVLSSADTNAALLVATSTAPAVASGALVTNRTAFRIQTPTNLPANPVHALALALSVDDGDGCPAEIPITLPIRDYATYCGLALDTCSAQPLPGIRVEAVTDGGLTIGPEFTGPDGRFCLNGIASTQAVLSFSSDTHAATSTPVTLAYSGISTGLFLLRNDRMHLSPPAGYAMTLGPETEAWGYVTLVNSGSCPLAYCLAGEDGSRDVALTTGYRYRHSGYRNGPAYGWTEIRTNGAPVALSDDDVEPLPIGFAFPFFGQAFTNLYLCSNGWLSFTDPGTTFASLPLPSPFAPKNMIAFHWADLNPANGGSVHYRTVDPETLVIQFTEVPYFGATNTITLQLVLSASGEIRINTRYMAPQADFVVTGLQDAEGAQGLTVFDPGNFPGSFTSVTLDPGPPFATLPAGVVCGTVGGGSSMVTPIRFSSRGLPGEHYAETLYFALNGGSRTLAVPVSLSVTGRFGYLVVTEPEAGPLACADTPPPVCSDTAPRAWGIWSTTGTTEAVRSVSGSSITLDFQNGWIQDGKTVGFNLRDGAETELLTFYFAGGEAHYSLLEAAGKVDTGIPWTGQGLRIHIELDGEAYTLRATRFENGQVYVRSGTLGFGGTAAEIRDLRFFNYEAGPGSNYDLFFNHIAVDGAMDTASQETYKDGWQTGDGMEGGLTPWTDLNAGSLGGHFMAENRNTGVDSTSCAVFAWSTNGTPLPVGYSVTDDTALCGDLRRVWSISEGGRTIEVERVYTVEDPDPPVFTQCPADLTVSNLAEAPVDLPAVQAVDDCSIPVVLHLGDTDLGGSETEADPRIIERRYGAFDACGNSAVCTQIIRVVSVMPVAFESSNLTPGGESFTLSWSADTQAWQYVDAMDHAPVSNDYPWITVFTMAPPSPAVSVFIDTNNLPGRNYRVRIVP